MRNSYSQFLALIPTQPLQVGVVIAAEGGFATVELPGGGVVRARGEAQVDQTVFVRDGVIEGDAPNLPIELIEI